MEKNLKKFFQAFSILSGTIIGVGFFSLPYITFKVGILTIVFYFLILGSLVYFLHSIFAQLCFQTPDFKRLPGFAKFHLGSFWEKIAFLITVVGAEGTLLAYLIVGGEFLNEIFLKIFEIKNFGFWVYFFLGCLFIFSGRKLIAKIEQISLFLMVFVLIFIFLWHHSLIDLKNFPIKPDFSKIFLPYGPIIFSLWGASLIPEIEETLRENKKLVKPVIFCSIFFSIVFYLLFIYLILGICGKNVSEYGILGLEKIIGEKTMILLLILGTLTTFTSFITIGLTIKKVFWYDFKIQKDFSSFLTIFFPLFLYFLGLKKYIKIISFIGGVFLGIEGILYLLMYKKSQKKYRKISLILICFLLFGIVAEFVNFFHT